MDLIEVSLCRLHDSVSQFVGPSAALRDVQFLKTQIELRQLALRDIAAIRSRLRPFIGCQAKGLHRRLRARRIGRPRLGAGRVRR